MSTTLLFITTNQAIKNFHKMTYCILGLDYNQEPKDTEQMTSSLSDWKGKFRGITKGNYKIF